MNWILIFVVEPIPNVKTWDSGAIRRATSEVRLSRRRDRRSFWKEWAWLIARRRLDPQSLSSCSPVACKYRTLCRCERSAPPMLLTRTIRWAHRYSAFGHHHNQQSFASLEMSLSWRWLKKTKVTGSTTQTRWRHRRSEGSCCLCSSKWYLP